MTRKQYLEQLKNHLIKATERMTDRERRAFMQGFQIATNCSKVLSGQKVDK
jgi:hypothetical protein